MAISRKIYTSQNQYLEDVARSTGYFDDSYYAKAKETGQDLEYLQMIASAKDNPPSIDRGFYDRLSTEDKFNYFASEQFMDKSSDEYKASQQYFDAKRKEFRNQDIYEGLNGFEKTLHSIGGWLGNAATQVLGIVEGLVDFAVYNASTFAQLTGVPAIFGVADELHERTKEFAAKDITGYTAVQDAMNEYINQYTFLDKNFAAKVVNDVTAGVVRMLPMFIPGAGQIGYVTYLTSAAGQTVEADVRANPDIGFGALLGHVGVSTGIEALTEWASGKIFGDDIISSIMKGEKFAPTGNIIKMVAKNSFTEGLEEVVAELFGGFLYNSLVDPTAPAFDIKTILYAGLIGGLTGGLMAGGNVLTTTRKSVLDGKLVDTKDLTKAQKKQATNLGLRKSYGLQALVNQVQQQSTQTTEVTKLLAKYGTSLDDIRTNHADEYKDARVKDIDTKKHQAKVILDLANLYQTIGVEQFQKSAKFLNEHLVEAQTLIDNYHNHTDVGNKAASEVFSALYPNETFTPVTIPSKPEQTLAQNIRKQLPNAKVVFGEFGHKEGLAHATISQGGEYIFIRSGLVEELGYEKVLQDVVKYEIANDLIKQLPTRDADKLATMAMGKDAKYSELTHDQKLAVTQMICFDQMFNQKTFFNRKDVHIQLFDYINKEAIKNKSNMVMYNSLLKIRNTFLRSISDAIGNVEDMEWVKTAYRLTDEEYQKKIVDATRTNMLNNTVKLTNLKFAEDTISKINVLKELMVAANVTEFDYSRLYDEEYYNEAFRKTIKKYNDDFKQGLIEYIISNYNTDINAVQIDTLLNIIKNQQAEKDVRAVAKELFTKEFMATATLEDIQEELANKLFWMAQTDPKVLDFAADSIIVTDDQIQGTGKLKFLKVKVDERIDTYNEQRQGRPSEGAREQVGSVVTKSTTIANKVTINQIDETSYNNRQKEMTVYAEKEYGVKLHFYEGSAILAGYDSSVDYGLNGFIYGDNDIYIRYDDSLPESAIEVVLLHEGTHKLINDNRDAYKILRDKLKKLAFDWDGFVQEYSSKEMYGSIYNNTEDVEEEIIVDICCGRVTGMWTDKNVAAMDAIFNFYNSVSHVMYSQESNYYRDNTALFDLESYDAPRKHTLSNRTAAWTQDRLDIELTQVNKYHDDPNKVVAYAAFVNPHDFVAATTNNALVRGQIRKEMREYSEQGVRLEDLKKNLETPFLEIDPISMEIVGHQGRHRMWSMYEAGITEVPILIFGYEYSDLAGLLYLSKNQKVANKVFKDVTFKGQTWYATPTSAPSKTYITFRDMIPFNESHRTDLEKYFTKGIETFGGPKIRFAKDISKTNKSAANAKTPKQIATSLVDIVKTSPMDISTAQGFDEEVNKEYRKLSRQLITDNYRTIFGKINDKNWKEIYQTLKSSTDTEAQAALTLMESYLFIDEGYQPLKDRQRFSEESALEIQNTVRLSETLAAQKIGMKSAALSEQAPISEFKQKLQENGFDVSVSDDVVSRYVPELKDKKQFEKDINEQITSLEKQIDDGDYLDQAELNGNLKNLYDKKHVLLNETNEKILDWVMESIDIQEEAAKIQKDVFEQMIKTGVKAAETEGKKAVAILVDDKTTAIQPFPKTTQWIQKNVKRLKSFRMWAMLTSPVSWVRNWVGNAGMTALDSMTNQMEKWLTARQPKLTANELMALEKEANELSRITNLAPKEQARLAEINNQIARYYDFKFVETKASKDLKKQIAENYKNTLQQILNGEDVKYETSAEKAAHIRRAERDITKSDANASLKEKLWAACQSMTDWGLNTGWFGDNAVVLNSLVKNFANMVESNKDYLIKSLTTEYGKNGRGMSGARKALVEKALKSKDSMDIVNAMSKTDVELFMDSCKQRTFEQYFKNSNWLSKWAANLSQKHPIAASLTSLVLPFPRVAANVLSMAYKYSPLGFISAIRQWSVVKQMDAAGFTGVRDAFAHAKLSRTTAQATIGTVMTIAGLIFAALGVIDIDEDDYLGPSLKIGDWKLSLSNLAPSMTTFSVGAAMMWAWKNDKSAAVKALDVLYDNTLLGNIENVFRYGSLDKYLIQNLSINYASQYVPAMLKLFARVFSNQATIDKTGGYFAKLFKTFGSGIPGVANLLPKKINPYTGEIVTGTGSHNVFFNFMEAISPLDMRWYSKSATQKEAERLGTMSNGLSGSFKVNDKEYLIDKVTYSKYRANYIDDTFSAILSGKQKVTVENEDGKRITTTYDKLTDKQKKNVLSRLYTDATTITKIKWWIDSGNQYIVTNKDLYNEYRSIFKSGNIIYRKTWTKSKFVERQ